MSLCIKLYSASDCVNQGDFPTLCCELHSGQFYCGGHIGHEWNDDSNDNDDNDDYDNNDDNYDIIISSLYQFITSSFNNLVI